MATDESNQQDTDEQAEGSAVGTEQGEPAAGWYADPLQRAEQRYYDGSQWTEHVVADGEQTVDPFGTDEKASVGKMTEGLGEHIMTGANATKFTGTAARWQGTGHLFTEPILVVEQHAKFVDTSSSYDISHPDGHKLGSVRQVGQSGVKQLVSAFTKWDKHMTHTFEILDADGNVTLKVTRPAKMMKSKVIVEGPDGSEVGQIVQKKAIGKVRFQLEAGGQDLGAIQGENWRDRKFQILDQQGEQIGRIAKSFEGLNKALLGGADHYVVEMYRPLDDPLRQLVVAAGVSVDTALHHED